MISLQDSQFEILESAANKRTEIAYEFFLRLPWENNNEEIVNSIFSSTEGISLDFTHDESLTPGVEIGSVSSHRLGVGTALSVQSFFSQLPWLMPDMSPANKIASALFTEEIRQTTGPEEEKASGTVEPIGNSFQSSTVLDPIKIGQAAVSIGSPALNDSEAAGIFSLAIQSSLRASRVAQVDKSSTDSQMMDSFFSNLPWKGGR